jgi:hypothetical protein
MASDANVQSLERLEEFLLQLGGIQERLGKQLDDVRVEMQRIDHWMQSECPGYWQEQERMAKRKWTDARERLLQCQSVVTAGERPSCSEHRKRLEKCTQRVALCERRMRQVRQCQLLWQQSCMQLRLKVQHVVDVVESRLPQARFHLDSSLEPLRQYARLSAPQAAGGTTVAGAAVEPEATP